MILSNTEAYSKSAAMIADQLVRNSESIEVEACNFGLSCRGGDYVEGVPGSSKGRFEVSRTVGGVFFCRGDVMVQGPVKERLVLGDAVQIRLGLAGEGYLEYAGGHHSYTGGNCRITDLTHVDHLLQVTPRESRYSAVVCWIPRGLITHGWGVEIDGLPTFWANFERGVPNDSPVLTLPLAGDLVSLASSIMQCDYKGVFLDLFLEGKARELVAALLHAAQDSSDAVASGRVVLSKRDFERLHEAHGFILEHYTSPPSLAKLGKIFGLNRNKLSTAFREYYGAPVFEYCRELKLQKSMQLLCNSDISITEIAMQMGYEHPPAFSAAFKKRFGCSPAQFRVRGELLP